MKQFNNLYVPVVIENIDVIYERQQDNCAEVRNLESCRHIACDNCIFDKGNHEVFREFSEQYPIIVMEK